MTKRVTIEILDDTDGSPAEQTVPFGLDGVTYEIDLSTTNANALREALAPYVVSARRSGGRRIKYEVADQGRISKTVIDAYHSSRQHLSTETNRKHQTETAAKRRPKPRK